MPRQSKLPGPKKIISTASKARPVARRHKSIFGSMKGRIKILGDIVSPLDVEWNVLKPDEKLDPD